MAFSDRTVESSHPVVFFAQAGSPVSTSLFTPGEDRIPVRSDPSYYSHTPLKSTYTYNESDRRTAFHYSNGTGAEPGYPLIASILDDPTVGADDSDGAYTYASLAGWLREYYGRGSLVGAVPNNLTGITNDVLEGSIPTPHWITRYDTSGSLVSGPSLVYDASLYTTPLGLPSMLPSLAGWNALRDSSYARWVERRSFLPSDSSDVYWFKDQFFDSPNRVSRRRALQHVIPTSLTDPGNNVVAISNDGLPVDPNPSVVARQVIGGALVIPQIDSFGPQDYYFMRLSVPEFVRGGGDLLYHHSSDTIASALPHIVDFATRNIGRLVMLHPVTPSYTKVANPFPGSGSPILSDSLDSFRHLTHAYLPHGPTRRTTDGHWELCVVDGLVETDPGQVLPGRLHGDVQNNASYLNLRLRRLSILPKQRSRLVEINNPNLAQESVHALAPSDFLNTADHLFEAYFVTEPGRQDSDGVVQPSYQGPNPGYGYVPQHFSQECVFECYSASMHNSIIDNGQDVNDDSQDLYGFIVDVHLGEFPTPVAAGVVIDGEVYDVANMVSTPISGTYEVTLRRRARYPSGAWRI